LAQQLGREAVVLTPTALARAKQEEDRVAALADTVLAISRLVKVLRGLQARLDAAPANQKLLLRVDLNI
jgi:hypothetical protein